MAGARIPEADLDERVVRIPLPPLRTGAQGIEPVDKERDLQAVMRERQVRLSEAMEQIHPDVFCVEFFPFSRWSLKSEILNTIVRLNEVNPNAKGAMFTARYSNTGKKQPVCWCASTGR